MPFLDGSRTFFGHPSALATLFFTEMWERFTFYGMRALLVLFLVDAVANGGYGLDDKTATAIYGLYTASVFMAALPGGWIADRLIGAQRAVIAGGVFMTIGNLMLATPGPPELFFSGLVVIVLGVGLLKPSISTLVADLYPEGGGRRDAGFTIFYMGINTGAFIGPLIAGWLALRFGWRVGFLAAAIGMPLGLLQFWLARERLGIAGATPHRNDGGAGLRGDWLKLALAVAVLAAADAGTALGRDRGKSSAARQERGLCTGRYGSRVLSLSIHRRGARRGRTAAHRRGDGHVRRLCAFLVRV